MANFITCKRCNYPKVFITDDGKHYRLPKIGVSVMRDGYCRCTLKEIREFRAKEHTRAAV